MKISKNFLGAKMNKGVDERIIPQGEYLDALNIRISSDESGEAGSLENARGNRKKTNIDFNGTILIEPKCIGTFEDGANETIYWFVASGNYDMILSYDTKTNGTNYHVVTTDLLNFSEDFPINDVNLIDGLLFFTDNRNQPRRINVTDSYPFPVNSIDRITEDDISVIVKPPINSPEITLVRKASKENYIEDKFIRFAYRYKYKNGEYSALSEFSDIAFTPRQFRLDSATNDMVGMRNNANNVTIKFNTGVSNVVGIDLCYKLSNSSIINVVERFDKTEKGWGDLNDVSVSFDNQKIYTTLTESELLRTYDNVPKLAKTQTAIGNRIMYANYVDGHDVDTVMDYSMDLISEDIGLDEVIEDEDDGVNYTIDTSKTVTDARLLIDLDGIEMKEGGSLFIDFNILHDSFGGDASYAGGPENDYQDTFQYIFPRDYDDAQDLATDPDFISSIQSDELFADSNDGYSLTDLFFSSIQAKSGWSAVGGGITSDTGDFSVTVSGSSIGLQTPAIKYELDATPGTFAYEYFLMSSTTASVTQLGNRESLHSNRDYELGIVYLDEYNRASTALVCNQNTLYVPPENSSTKNSIKATVNHLAPSWANRYRFVLKPSKGGYETIYSYIYFYSQEDSAWWLLLEGDNQTKAKVGDRLIVKTSSSGVTSDVVKTKILDIKAQERDFITDVTSPPGLYMKIRASGFSLNTDENAVINYGTVSAKNDDAIYGTTIANPDFDDSSPVSSSNKKRIEYDIPVGSFVQITFSGHRDGNFSQYFKFDRVFTASRDYDNFYDFIVGEKINFNNPTNKPDIESDAETPDAEWINSIGDYNDYYYDFSGNSEGEVVILSDPSKDYGTTRIKYYRNNNTGDAFLGFKSAGRARRGKNYYTKVEIIVSRSGNLLAFETEPNEIDSETYYETSKSFPIENRYHMGGLVDQTASSSAVINVKAFDCYSFGNGVESFKINDGLADPGFNIGARVTAVSKQDYKETRRYADITYSGVYNEESNVNKLNEFNLALVNWKTLENAFGPIEKIHARQNDILVLQEDKISTVLTGKNLLSDAAGGGAITSSLEVLGKQISRIEEYGISNNPESFAHYGSDIFFTDVKRGAVINLTGNSLDVISDNGMGSYFRDSFNVTSGEFKLGSFDPYSKEYVLSVGAPKKEKAKLALSCGITRGRSYDEDATPYTFSVNLGSLTGTVDIDYFGKSEGIGLENSPGFQISVVYDGNTVVDQFVDTFGTAGEGATGTISFNKTYAESNIATITVVPTYTSFNVTVGCVESDTLTVIRMVSNTDQMEDLTINHEYSWSMTNANGVVVSDSFTFGEGPVSLYETLSGPEGQGSIPGEGATVTMKFIKKSGDTADFDSDKFKFLVSDTLYTQADIDTLTPLLSEVTSTTNPDNNVYEGTFTYTNTTNKPYLYLVWDYVEPLITCTSTLSASGGAGMYEVNVEVGEQVGDTSVVFNAQSVPDRFQIEWNGSIVADSLFVGDGLNSTYITEIENATTINKFLWNGASFEANGTATVDYDSSDASDTTTLRPTTGNGSVGNQLNVEGGYPTGTPYASDGDVKLTFNKTATHPTTFTVRAIGVNSGTAWSINQVDCPDGSSTGDFNADGIVTDPVDPPAPEVETESFYTQDWTWTVGGNPGGTVEVAIIQSDTGDFYYREVANGFATYYDEGDTIDLSRDFSGPFDAATGVTADFVSLKGADSTIAFDNHLNINPDNYTIVE